MDKGNNVSNRLKHRMAQMLLSSSCATASIINISDGISQEPGFFPIGDLHVPRRGKLDHRPHRMAPLVQVSIDCSGRTAVHATSPKLPQNTEEEKRNQKKERRVTETGVVYETGAGEGRKCPPASPSSCSNDYYHSHSKDRKKGMAKKKDKFARQKKKLLSNGYGISSSSSISSNDGFGFFNIEGEEEEEEEETWTLFSSKSFSSDSSEFYLRPSSKKKTKTKKFTRRPPRRGARYFKAGWDEGDMFQPLISISSTEKKEKAPKAAEACAGFPVVKQSSNPYEDFRSSMVEMITERRMSKPDDLEQLLHSYLSLNSSCHHPVILEAFADIWEAIFS